MRHDADVIAIDTGIHQLVNGGFSLAPAIKQTNNIWHNCFSSLRLSLGETCEFKFNKMVTASTMALLSPPHGWTVSLCKPLKNEGMLW
jgi:hypothetical protein